MSLNKVRHQETGHRILIAIGCIVYGKLFDEETCKFHEHYDAAKGTFAGLPVRVCEGRHFLDGTEMVPQFLVAAYMADMPYGITMIPPELFTTELNEKHRTLVREALEPLGLWDEMRFGLWCFN